MSLRRALERLAGRQNLLDRGQAERAVLTNSDIADFRSLKLRVLRKLSQELPNFNASQLIAAYLTKSRIANLGSLVGFINDTFGDENSKYDLVKQLRFQIQYARSKGLKLSELRDDADSFDDTFNNKEDMIDLYLETILNEPKLRQVWLDKVDEKVRKSSEKKCF